MREERRKREVEENHRRIEKRRQEEEERIKIEEEIQEKEAVKIENKEYQTMLVKNVPLKTFYSEYIQKKYDYENETFPERKSGFINIISSRTNTSSNINKNSIQGMNIYNSENLILQNNNIQNSLIKSSQSEFMACPGCGRMTSSQFKSGMQNCTCKFKNVSQKEKSINTYQEGNFQAQQNQIYENNAQNTEFNENEQNEQYNIRKQYYMENEQNEQIEQNMMKEQYDQNGQYYLNEMCNQNEQIEYNLENEQGENQQLVQNFMAQKRECLCPECKNSKENKISSERKICPKCKKIYV